MGYTSDPSVIKIDSAPEVQNLAAQLAETAQQSFNDGKQSIVPNNNSAGIAGWIDDDVPIGFLTNLKPTLDANNVKISLGAITQAVQNGVYPWGGTPMSKGDLLSLQDEGFEIISHSLTHDSSLWYQGNLLNADENALKNELLASQKWLKDNGFRGWDTFVFPGGGYTFDEQTKAKRLVREFYKYGINSGGNYRKSPIDMMFIDRFAIGTPGLNFNTDIKPTIDAAIADKALIVFITHSGGTSGMDINLVQQTIAYLQQNNISIMPVRQALAQKANALDIENYSNGKRIAISTDGNTYGLDMIIQGLAPDNGFTLMSPISSYPNNCRSILLVRPQSDTLTGEGLRIKTFRGTGGFEGQEITSITSQKVYRRMWNSSSSAWGDFIFIGPSISFIKNFYTDIAGNTIDDAPTKFQTGETEIQIRATADNITGEGGVVKVYKGEIFAYEYYVSLTSCTVKFRTGNAGGSSWNAWNGVNNQFIHVNNGRLSSDPLSAYLPGIVEYNEVGGSQATGFPENIAGTLITFRGISDVFSWQEYHIRQANRVYKRYADVNNSYAWTTFEKISAV